MVDKNELRLVQKQLQKMTLTPKMQQALHLLQIPLLELKVLLQQEMVKNPLLEEAQEGEESEGIEEGEETRTEENIGEGKEEESVDSILDRLSELDDKGQEYFQNGDMENRDKDETARKRDFSLDVSAIRSPTIQEHLTGQLRLSTSVQEEFLIGEHIIGCIDDNGYLQTSVAEIAKALEVSLLEAEKVLALIQSFDPVGVGARNLKECLLLQIKSRRLEHSTPAKIIENYLEKLEKRKYRDIANALSVPLEEVYAAVNIISTLEPKPGKSLSAERASYITPDIFLKKMDGEYVIILNDEEIPRLKLNKQYKKMLREKGGDESTQKYLKGMLSSAIWLMRNVEYRKKTIYKVTEAIVNSQKEFLDKGLPYLKPMTLQEVANAISMHESTVSRITSNKYIDTPQGLFELKYFFTRGMKNDKEGRVVSVEVVKETINRLIEKESPDNPVTDSQIRKEILSMGINMSIRTVTKYRDELKQLPANMRKSKGLWVNHAR